MAQSVSREAANVAIVTAFYAVGATCAGPVGAAASGIAGEMAAGLVERGWDHVRDRYLSDQGIREPDLRAAMRRAYVRAIQTLEQQWSRLESTDRRPRNEDREVVRGLFQMLREDAEQVFTDEGLMNAINDPEILRVLGAGVTVIRNTLNSYLDQRLLGHDEGLALLVRRGLEPELAVCFTEELKADRPESDRAWRAYQRLVLESLLDGVMAVRSGHDTVDVRLGEIEQVLRRIEAWSQSLVALPVEERDRTGEAELELLVIQARGQVLEIVLAEAVTTRTLVIEQGDDMRQAVAAVGNQLRELHREVRHRDAVPDSDVLLRGPIRALGLQPELDRADALRDRLAAIPLYDVLLDRLRDRGHLFHSRLTEERRAEAFAAGGAIEEAYAVWLEVGKADLEGGSLWISAFAERGLDKHRNEVGSALAARANAIRSLEAWFEHPAAATRALRQSLEALDEVGDAWAPIVALWLGEAVAVDGGSKDVAPNVLRSLLERFASAADDSTAVRQRLLLAEATGGWKDLLDQASTGMLEPSDAGLVLCRHGRWLALEAQPEDSIAQYRRAIDKLTQANLLGDCSGALRAIAKVQMRYIDGPTTIQENFDLARMVADQPNRFTRRHDTRSAAIEALHEGGRRLPDAHRNLRRYLWEARISGHLQAELDARRLLGDLYRKIGELGAAVGNYILGGQDKDAHEVARSAPAIDVAEYLNRRAPWEIGSALAVVAAQGDWVPNERVERDAPRLIELTAGVRQRWVRPEVEVEAWKALAAVALQLSDESAGAVLDRLEPLIEREPGHYRRMDDSLLDLLVQFHRHRPGMRDRVANAILRCLTNFDLASELKPYLAQVVDTDEMLRTGIVALADTGDRVAIGILAAADVKHPSVRREAKTRSRRVLDHRVGEVRNEVSISDAFEEAAVFASFLPPRRRDELAAHLLAIARDTLSPEAYRASAANALGILADRISDSVRTEVFEGSLMLALAEPSTHPIDAFWKASLHPLSRFTSDLAALNLRRAAMWSAGRSAATREHADRLLHSVVPAINSGDERDLAAAISAILGLEATIRPEFDLEQLTALPQTAIRVMAASLWSDDPSANPSLGLRLAADPSAKVRRHVAMGLDRLAMREPEHAEELRIALSMDPSASVRAEASRSEIVLRHQ